MKIKSIPITNFSADLTITPLIEGYKRFKSQYFEKNNSFDALIKHGQKPKTLVVACCDSRTDPAIITGCQPGDLFVVRNIANLVPPFDDRAQHYSVSASLEFGVLGLDVHNIIVLGHSHCGGIRALMEAPKDKNSSSTIIGWMNIAKTSKQKVLAQHPRSTHDKQCYYCEKESLLTSLNNLTTFPWIKERVLKRQLSLHAWYFNLETGAIETYQETSKKFFPL